jgi:predicted metal-dependent enzyme (double-stranded beta helix superfamily)
MDLNRFCRTIGKLTADNPVETVPGLIAGYLPEVLANGDLLAPEQKMSPPDSYERHEIFLCPNDDFSVLALVWPAGIVSPIHDHKTWCAFGVFEGVIRETRYDRCPDREGCLHAVPVETKDWVSGDVVHLSVGGSDIHCMHNPTDRAAVSIHVYGGNYTKIGPNVVNVYEETQAATA